MLGKEDIISRQVSVYDGWSLAVKVVQTQGHVVKYGVAHLLRQNTVRINTPGEGGREELHDKDWNTRALLKVDTDELHNVRVTYLR